MAEDITGEYWIHDDGDAEYCDGDIGDMNHEGIVLNRVQRDIVEKVGDVKKDTGSGLARGIYVTDDGVDWDGWKDAKANELLVQRYGEQADDHEDEGEELLLQAAHGGGVSDEEWEAAEGLGDLRDFAMEHWGWKAVRGPHVDTWTLTPHDMSTIAAGLNDILDQEGNDADEDDEPTFAIIVHSSGKSFEMTVSQLEAQSNNQPPPEQEDEPEADPEQVLPPQQKPSSAPTSRSVSQDIDFQQDSARNYARQADMENMPDYYRNKKHPFADWTRPRPTFREWVQYRDVR